MSQAPFDSQPSSEAEFGLARLAVQRGWVTQEQVEVALASYEKDRGTRLLAHLPLSSEQIRELENPSTRPVPPEAAEAMMDPTRKMGRYWIVKHLGSGGMGMVFRAWDPELHRWIAIKSLKQIGDDMARAYFHREAQLAAGLNHPNIAAIYEVGEHQGMPFIAMQFVDGQNFAAARKRMTLVDVARAMKEAASAVDYAHRQGIVHRDLKPANLMLDTNGRVYVMDFGLAKQTEVEGLTARLSGSNIVLGTPQYMPPEQARGNLKLVDRVSDVYSLGATLYEMLAGHPPFVSESSAEILVKVLSEDPAPPRRIVPGLPRDLETITLKCLEKERARRYATAQDVADDLALWLAGDAIKAHSPSMSYRARKFVSRRKLASVFALAFVLAAGASAYLVPKWIGESRLRKESEARAVAEREQREKEAGARVETEEQLKKESKQREEEGRAHKESETRLESEKEAESHARKEKEAEAAREKEEKEKEAKARKESDTKATAEELERKKLQFYLPIEGQFDLLRLYFYRPNFSLTKVELDKYGDLIRQIEDEMKKTGECAQGHYLIGRCREVSGDVAGADAAYAKAMERDASHGKTLLYRGRLRIERALTQATEAAGLTWHESRKREQTEAAIKEATAAVEWIERATTVYGAGIEIDLGRAYVEVIKVFGRGGVYDSSPMLKKWKDQPYVEEFLLLEAISSGTERRISAATLVLDKVPSSYRAYYWRATGRSAMSDFEGAISDYTRSLEINPRFEGAYYQRANARVDKGDLDGGIVDFTKALELNPLFTSAYNNRGIAFYKNRKYDAAIADYDKVLGINNQLVEVYTNRGNARHDKGDLDCAIEDHTKALEIEPRFALAYHNRGNAYVAKADPERAIADYTKCIELDPKYAPAYNNRGNRYCAKGEFTRAIADYTRVIELNPSDTWAFYNRGYVRVQMKEPDAAIADFTKALELDPRNVDAYIWRGNVKSDKRDYDGAIADQTKALEIEPSNADAYTNRGNARHNKRDYQGALADFTKALEINPRHYSANYSRGNTRRIRGDWDGAIADFTNAVEIDPKNGYALLGRAQARRGKRDLDGAIADCEKALEVTPADWAARKWTEDYLKKARADKK